MCLVNFFKQDINISIIITAQLTACFSLQGLQEGGVIKGSVVVEHWALMDRSL